MLKNCQRLDTSTQGEYTKSKSELENLKDFNGWTTQTQILPLRPALTLERWSTTTIWICY